MKKQKPKNAYDKYHDSVFITDSEIFAMFENLKKIKDDDKRNSEIVLILDWTGISTIEEVEDYVKNIPVENRFSEEVNFNRNIFDYSYAECMEYFLRHNDNEKWSQPIINKDYIDKQIERAKVDLTLEIIKKLQQFKKENDQELSDIRSRTRTIEGIEQARRQDEMEKQRESSRGYCGGFYNREVDTSVYDADNWKYKVDERGGYFDEIGDYWHIDGGFPK